MMSKFAKAGAVALAFGLVAGCTPAPDAAAPAADTNARYGELKDAVFMADANEVFMLKQHDGLTKMPEVINDRLTAEGRLFDFNLQRLCTGTIAFNPTSGSADVLTGGCQNFADIRDDQTREAINAADVGLYLQKKVKARTP